MNKTEKSIRDIRKDLTEKLRQVTPNVYSICQAFDQQRDSLADPAGRYIVLVLNSTMPTASNRSAVYDIWDVICYVDKGSIHQLDRFINEAMFLFKDEHFFKLTGVTSGDACNSNLGRCMRAFEIQTMRVACYGTIDQC